MNLPKWMTMFVPQKPDDMKLLRVWDAIRTVDYKYRSRAYEKKYIGESIWYIKSIDEEYCSVLLMDMWYDWSYQFHYGKEYIIDRMNVWQELKYLFRWR